MTNGLLERELTELAQTDLYDLGAVNYAALRLEELLIGEPVAEAHDPSEALGQSIIAATTKLYEIHETGLEKSFAEKIIRGEAILEDYPLYGRFERLISKEVELASIKANSKVLFIGSGPFPISAMLLYEISGGAKIDCFDLSQEACEISEKVLKKLGMSGDIKVQNLAAESACLPTISERGEIGGYDVVIAALLAQPKDKILHKIWQSVGLGPRYIIRNSEGNRRVIYEGVESNAMDHRHYDVIGSYHAGIGDTISGTVLKSGSLPMIYKV